MGRTCGWSQTYSRMSPSCVAATPTTLATSSAAPPPKPMMQSAPCSLKALAPAITWAQVGLPNTPSKTTASSGARCERNSAITGSAASARSVTISGRLQPAAARCAATCLRAPAPKWMSVGKEKAGEGHVQRLNLPPNAALPNCLSKDGSASTVR